MLKPRVVLGHKIFNVEKKRMLNLNCDREGEEMKRALMYNVWEGFLRLCDVPHEQNGGKVLKLLKESGFFAGCSRDINCCGENSSLGSGKHTVQRCALRISEKKL